MFLSFVRLLSLVAHTVQQNRQGAPQIVVGNDEFECNARCVCECLTKNELFANDQLFVCFHKVARCRPSARRRRRVLLLWCLCCFVRLARQALKISSNAISCKTVLQVACVTRHLAFVGKIHWETEIDALVIFGLLLFLLFSMYEKSLSLSVVKFIDKNLFLFAASCVSRCRVSFLV